MLCRFHGTPATVTEVGAFADILRRRLLEFRPTTQLIAATAEAYRPVLEDKAWTRNVQGQRKFSVRPIRGGRRGG